MYLEDILTSYLQKHDINKISALSGWAQNSDFLSFKNSDISNKIHYFDYSILNIKETFDQLQEFNPEIAIGWSLGGQIIIDAIIAGKIQPKFLILLATPFQFINAKSYDFGIDNNIYLSFSESLKLNPSKILRKFHLMMLQGDNRFNLLKNKFLYDDNFKNLQYWLDYLANFSGFEKNFDNFCQTELIYGKNDMIVNYNQANLFQKKISNSHIKIIENYSHIVF